MSATLTIPEAADLLGVSVNSAYTAAKTGELAGVPVIRVGARRLLIPRAPFLAVLGLNDGDPPKGAVGEMLPVLLGKDSHGGE